MKYRYFINGFEYGRSYFLSFGFSESQIERMKDGEKIERIRDSQTGDTNIFEIRQEEEL